MSVQDKTLYDKNRIKKLENQTGGGADGTEREPSG